MERLLNMILRRLMNKGLNSGIRAMSKRGQPDGKDTQEQRQTTRKVQNNSRNLRQATRILRRFNRF